MHTTPRLGLTHYIAIAAQCVLWLAFIASAFVWLAITAGRI